jgi:hypothetical protein
VIGEGDEALGDFASKIGRELLENGSSTSISLDEVAARLGDKASDTSIVAAVLDFLESEGATVDAGPSPDLVRILRDVLVTARLVKSQGASLRVASIAEKLDVEPRLVRVALLYAEVLMRGKSA